MYVPSINVSVNVKAGASIQRVCEDVKELAEHLDTVINFTFNGVEMTTRNQSIKEMVDGYVKQRPVLQGLYNP